MKEIMITEWFFNRKRPAIVGVEKDGAAYCFYRITPY